MFLCSILVVLCVGRFLFSLVGRVRSLCKMHRSCRKEKLSRCCGELRTVLEREGGGWLPRMARGSSAVFLHVDRSMLERFERYNSSIAANGWKRPFLRHFICRESMYVSAYSNSNVRGLGPAWGVGTRYVKGGNPRAFESC